MRDLTTQDTAPEAGTSPADAAGQDRHHHHGTTTGSGGTPSAGDPLALPAAARAAPVG